MSTDWAGGEFEAARLWDGRCRSTLVHACHRLAAGAGLSLSRVLGSQRKAVSHLLHHPNADAADLLAGHTQATARRCQEHDLILVASDTTALDRVPALRVGGIILPRRASAPSAPCAAPAVSWYIPPSR